MPLHTARGTVLTRCRQRHRHQEYLDFLRQIDQNVPPDLEVHVIVDNYATHKHPRVKRWLATRPRFHVHFTPTYASWLNQVEIWFNRITQRAIRRGTFRSVKELVTKIDQFVENDNQNARDSTLGAREILRLSQFSGTRGERREGMRRVNAVSEDKLVVGISGRALFDLTEEHVVFLNDGRDAYKKFQRERENQVLKPGTGFPLVQGLLLINEKLGGNGR